MIRAAAIIQALLGNIGRPGGGILALRGHSSIQGSTDIPTLYNLLPGYLPQPHACKRASTTSKDYIEARADADRLVAQLPEVHRQPAARLVRRRGHAGERLGLRVAAEDRRRPLAAADDARHPRRHHPRPVHASARTRSIGGHNTAHDPARPAPTWNGWSCARPSRTRPPRSGTESPEVESGELRPEDIKTEVFLMPGVAARREGGHLHQHAPAASSGTTRSSTRRATAAPRPWFIYHLGRRLKAAVRRQRPTRRTSRSRT